MPERQHDPATRRPHAPTTEVHLPGLCVLLPVVPEVPHHRLSGADRHQADASETLRTRHSQ
eukprot:13645717-Heterocapsa_arctica.AAC.1